MKYLLFLFNRICTKFCIKESYIFKVMYIILYNNFLVIFILFFKFVLNFLILNFFGFGIKIKFFLFFCFLGVSLGE